MDKAIIFGIYDFVSFHSCKRLLNKGIEVTGVHMNEIYKHQFLEEKRLEVGRNANYRELSLADWETKQKEEKDNAKTTFIFSVYDLYMQNNESILHNELVIRPIRQYLEDHQNIGLAVYLPIQMLVSNRDKTLSAFLEQAKGWGRNIQCFYLPAIYGTWQPLTFSFQQAILSKLQKINNTQNDREWKKDVLYVNDAVEAIFKTIESRMNENAMGYIIESGKNDYWNQCAAYLQMDEGKSNGEICEPLQMDSQMVRLSVKKVTAIADSFKDQMEQVQYLYQNHT